MKPCFYCQCMSNGTFSSPTRTINGNYNGFRHFRSPSPIAINTVVLAPWYSTFCVRGINPAAADQLVSSDFPPVLRCATFMAIFIRGCLFWWLSLLVAILRDANLSQVANVNLRVLPTILPCFSPMATFDRLAVNQRNSLLLLLLDLI